DSDRLRVGVARFEHALAVADRARQLLADVFDTFLRRARAGVPCRTDGQQAADDEHEQDPTGPALQRPPLRWRTPRDSRHPYAWRSCCSSPANWSAVTVVA